MHTPQVFGFRTIPVGLIALTLAMGAIACTKKKTTDGASASAQSSVTSLQIEDLTNGTGAEATTGKTVTVEYVGKLTDGREFDSSKKSGRSFSFTLGAGEVIKGWDQGVAGMKVGGKRRLTIPAALGYGAAGVDNVIPPNATLIFEVELKDVK